jgi:hypothetical protein
MNEFMNYTYPTNTKKYSMPIIIDKGFSFFLFPFCDLEGWALVTTIFSQK